MDKFLRSSKFQRLSFFGGLIASGLFLFASLSVMTDVARLMNFVDIVEGASIFKEMQPFADSFFTLAILTLAFCTATFIFFCQKRRRFYLSNYITAGLFSVFSFVSACYALINTLIFSVKYGKVDTVMLKEVSGLDPWGYHYSYLFFIISIVICIFTILVATCIALSTIMKYCSLKAEKAQAKSEEGDNEAANNMLSPKEVELNENKH